MPHHQRRSVQRSGSPTRSPALVRHLSPEDEKEKSTIMTCVYFDGVIYMGRLQYAAAGKYSLDEPVNSVILGFDTYNMPLYVICKHILISISTRDEMIHQAYLH